MHHSCQPINALCSHQVSAVNQVIDEEQHVFKDFVRRYGMKVAKMRSTGRDPGVLDEISNRAQSDSTKQWGSNLTPFEIALASQAVGRYEPHGLWFHWSSNTRDKVV